VFGAESRSNIIVKPVECMYMCFAHTCAYKATIGDDAVRRIP
jgi:hypothetical protein